MFNPVNDMVLLISFTVLYHILRSCQPRWASLRKIYLLHGQQKPSGQKFGHWAKIIRKAYAQALRICMNSSPVMVSFS